MSEHDPAPAAAPVAEPEPRDAVDVDTTVPMLQPPPQDAGWRARRRVRRGASLASGLWLGGLLLLGAAAAVASTPWWLAPPSSIPAVDAPPSALSLSRELAAALRPVVDEGRQATQVLAARLATALAAPPVVVLVEGADEQAARDADNLARLKERVRGAVAGASPPLQIVVVDDKGGVVYTAGELAADAPALTSLLSALSHQQALPPARVAALSAPRHDGLRVAVLFTAPLLVDAPLAQAATRAQQIEQRVQAQAQLLGNARDDVTRARRQWFILTAMAVAVPLLAALLLWLGSARRLRRSLALLLERSTRRAAGQDVGVAQSLPLELAAVDEMVEHACAAAEQERELQAQQHTLQTSLGTLCELCRQAAQGDLSARATPASDVSAALAVELNHLIESFEQRALRLRSHARGAADGQDAAWERAASVEGLRRRSGALGPLPQLLADIAARLRGFAEQLERGDGVQDELRKLADAVAARARTARAYLTALGEAVAGIEGAAQPSPRVQQIEEELATLTLDGSFASEVGALRELGAQEIQRRLDEAHADDEGTPRE